MSNVEDLTAWVADRRADIVADLTAFVFQETPSDDKALLDSGLAWVEDWLSNRLGEPDTRRQVDGGQFGDTLVLDYESGNESDSWITALAHYDTVWPRGTLIEWQPRLEGDRFTGPGAFDMKGGLVQFVWALKSSDRPGPLTPQRATRAQRRRGSRQPGIKIGYRRRSAPWRRSTRVRTQR